MPMQFESREMPKNDIVLSFHESLLRICDVELLRGPYWLNDTLISFYFEYLEIKRFQRDPTLLFIAPQVTQCIKIAPTEEINVFLDPLRPHKRRFIFFALNDNERTDVSGGSHWSLLVYSNPDGMVYHFDSSRGSNQDQAVEMSEKILSYFGLSTNSFKEISCLQQSNGYDCGIHVIINAEKSAEYALRCGRIEGGPSIDRSEVENKRNEILNLILEMKQQ